MKKILVLFLVGIIAICMCGCSLATTNNIVESETMTIDWDDYIELTVEGIDGAGKANY